MMSDPMVIYEDAAMVVLNKPSGLMVHPVKIGDKKSAATKAVAEKHVMKAGEERESTLVDWLIARYPEIKMVGDDPIFRPGIVHRLDKDTSGVMVVARTQDAYDYLKALFQKHEMVKTYVALVAGTVKKESGVIDAPIGIVTGSTRRSVRSKKMAKEAVTEYRTLKHETRGASQECTLLEVQPKTGRTHQIRVHLASIGHPIAGDPLYGTKISRSLASRLMLHAFSIEFTARNGKRMMFEAEIPGGF